MSNLTTYQTFNDNQPMPEAAPTWQPVRVVSGTQSVTMTDGEVSSEFKGQDKASSNEASPYHGTEGLFATARNQNGTPVMAIGDDTLLTLPDGMQAAAKTLASLGVITKNPDGSYSEGGQQQAPQAAPSGDLVPLPQDHAELLQAAIGDMPDAHAMSVAAAAIGAITGRLDAGAVVAKFQSLTGMDAPAAAQRVGAMQAVFQAQTDFAVTKLYGIGEADRDAFYAFCRGSKREAMADALGRQIHGNDVSGWRGLAQQFLSTQAPSVEAFKRAGVPTRPSHHKAGDTEVFVGGSWMSRHAAARAGLA